MRNRRFPYVRFLCATALFFGLSFPTLRAQATAAVSGEIVYRNLDTAGMSQRNADTAVKMELVRGISIPLWIEDTLYRGHYRKGVRLFEEFLSQLDKADPYHLLYVRMIFWYKMQGYDPQRAGKHRKKAEVLKRRIIDTYPEMSDTYLLRLDENSAPEEIIDMATRAIEADPRNMDAYYRRSLALFRIGETRKACLDMQKYEFKEEEPLYRRYCTREASR